MSEQPSSSPAPLATVIASAAVTVAVGITAAALGGYIVPARDQPAPPADPGGREAPPALSEPWPTGPKTGVQVVLVPVAPDTPAVSAGAEPEPMLAEYEPREREEHHGTDRGHRAHEGEDEHDDD